MSTFNITSSTLNTNYEYKNDVVFVSGNFTKDATNDTLQNINGSVSNIDAQGNPGTYIGNFSGYMRDDEIRYSLSEMSRRDSNKVWDAIDEIEQYVTGENNEE